MSPGDATLSRCRHAQRRRMSNRRECCVSRFLYLSDDVDARTAELCNVNRDETVRNQAYEAGANLRQRCDCLARRVELSGRAET